MRSLSAARAVVTVLLGLGLAVAPANAVPGPGDGPPGPPTAPTVPAAASSGPADEPTYQVVEREVLIRMDDGVRLAATVAWPSRDGAAPLPGRRPVVFGMTPYGRNALCGCYPPSFWASRGMVGAVVDTRGTGGSGGDLEGNYFSPREARDGAALVEWFGTRRWSSGRVGMAGGSYVGITQLLAAARRPEHLAAIVPQVALSDLYRDAYTHGGVPNLFFDAQYVAVQGAPGTVGTNSDPALLEESVRAKLGQSAPLTPAFDYLARPDDGRFYRARSPIESAHRIEVPVLLVGGWRDGLSQRGAPELYRVLARRPGVETRLLMDPCTHKGCGAPFAPLTDPAGQEDTTAAVVEFLRKHLEDAPVPARPRVSYFLQGADRFATSSSWPPRRSRPARFRFAEVGLVPDGEPAGRAGTRSYVTEPAAGLSMAFHQYGTVAATPFAPTDQRLEGPHGVALATAPLRDGLTIAGPSALRLVASTTAPDTDWHVRVLDVAPDGSETLVTEGSLRASHRELDRERSTPLRPFHTHRDPRPVEPGRFEVYRVEIWPTAYRFAPGHRLQLRITSTDLPTHLPARFRVDPDDPTTLEVVAHQPAVNTVRLRGSSLLLPVLGP